MSFNTKKSLAAALADIGVKVVFNFRMREGGIPQHKLTYDVHSCWISTNCTLDEIFEHGQRHKAHILENKRLAAEQCAKAESDRKAQQQELASRRRAEQQAETRSTENDILEMHRNSIEQNFSSGYPLEPGTKRIFSILDRVASSINSHRKALAEFTEQLNTNSAFALEWANDMFARAANYKVAMQLGAAILKSEEDNAKVLAQHLDEFILKEIVRRAGKVPSSTSVTSNLMENYERAAWAEFHSSKCW